MSTYRACCGALMLAALVSACGAGASSGELQLLTYNVAGLPQGISSSNPLRNIPLISPLLNGFELVLVQEDFYYQDQLRKDVTHAHLSEPQRQGVPTGFGDGLNRFSRFPFRDFARKAFNACYGADCMAKKGLSVGLTRLAEGVEVDIYNLHLNAGSDQQDNAARKVQVDLLLSTIATRSAGRALIVAGDFNLKYRDGGHDVQMLQRLGSEGGLTQVCEALKCGDDRVDRVFYRGSEQLSWTPLARIVEARFVDSQGVDLSDHQALSARLSWSSR